MLQSQQEPGEPSPVVTHYMGALKGQRVQQPHCIVCEGGGVVATARCLAPSEAAQVGHEQAVMIAKLADHPAPAPPMLWPAVQQQHRCPRARLGQMEPDPATVAWEIEPAVLDSGQGREPVQSGRRGRNGHDLNLSPSRCCAKLAF